MECPKCHKTLSDNETVCPHCHKVLSLVCPNCRTLVHDSVCSNCGYIILEKCSKCGKTVPTSKTKCKCGFPVKTSIAYQECESDEFASITIKFCGLKNIRRILSSQELYAKFLIKLKNLLKAQLKNIEGHIISYGETYVVNLSKDLSFPTSANKATRIAIKIANAFTSLNKNVVEEFGTPLKLTIYITQKKAEELLENKLVENKVKLLTVKKEPQKYLKGMQIILDEYTQDAISKDYKTESLYSVEDNGTSCMYYEIILDGYILPPDEYVQEAAQIKASELKPIAQEQKTEEDLYSFKVFDINAKCKFEKAAASEIIGKLDTNKIVALRGVHSLNIDISKILNYYKQTEQKFMYVNCTEEMNYKPWAVMDALVREYYRISEYNNFIPRTFEIPQYPELLNLIKNKARKASTSEDARFAYMEDFGNFLASLENTNIIIDSFEFMDDTSIQTLDLFFDRFQKLKAHFIFITDDDTPLHGKIKGLMQTPLYTEVKLHRTLMDTILSELKEDASDFIQSFYYEKIKANFQGSRLYYDNAIAYLKEKDVLISFEGKLIVKNNNSVILPSSLEGLYKSRLKTLSKNQDASMILAYSALLGQRLDYRLLQKLEIKDIQKNVKLLEDAGFLFTNGDFIYINNYKIIKPVILSSLKKDVEEYLVKNILAKLGKGLDNTSTLLLMGKIGLFKEEYLLLWKNSQYAIATGDFDAYLKNCVGFLSILDNVKTNVPPEEIENNKKEVYQNILISLYAYSPEKIYSIEQVLLIDAIKANDNDKIVKLSNLMLQGALISSNYTDALSLMRNILSRMKNPTLYIDGAINTKFLLLLLVNVEIQFNIGDYAGCIETVNDLLNVIKPDIIEKIKPSSFSLDLFKGHLMDTYRLAGFAMLFSASNELEEFFEKVKQSTGEELPEKDCIIEIKNFLAGKDFNPVNVENITTYSKVIYLILQEFADHLNDYKSFAQNIYQAKLLAADIHQKQLELLCDILIGHSYANIGIVKKAEAIFNDVLEQSKNSAIFNTIMLANYFIAKLKIKKKETEGALLIINDSLAYIQNHSKEARIIYALFAKLLIDIVKENEISFINIETEQEKLKQLFPNNELKRLLD